MMRSRTPLLLLLALPAALLLAGCSNDDDPLAVSTPTAISPEKDAAEAIAADLGSDDGGLMDQLADAVSFAGTVDIGAKEAMCEGLRSAVYDEETGTWTVTVERERGVPDGVPYAAFTRVYTVRFLDADGLPQMHYNEDGALAVSIEFDIVSGSGVLRTYRLERTLDALEGSFVITDADQDIVTINGTYLRTAGHHLEAPHFSRDHEGTLALELLDVRTPRREPRNMSEAVSGTLTGTYDATIVVERGEVYKETEIHREFTITLGDGEADMSTTRNRYRARLRTGELIDP